MVTDPDPWLLKSQLLEGVFKKKVIKYYSGTKKALFNPDPEPYWHYEYQLGRLEV
jgi:hypothetical protein